MNREEVLKRNLHKLQAFHPAYGGGLSNHLPMALIALYRLGAGEKRLEDYFQSASSHLEMASPPRERFTDIQALENGGTGRYYPEYRVYFRTALLKEGLSAVLKKWLFWLAPGLTAHAFHPMIRLAYGLDIHQEEEIASGLAYWADNYKALGEGKPEEIGAITLRDFLALIQKDPGFDPALLPNDLIHIKMAEVAKRPGFQKVLGFWNAEHHHFETLLELACRWYLCCGDFTSLHGVTSCHALSSLLDYTEEPERLMRYYWQAFCAAYLTVAQRTLYQGNLSIPELSALPDWELILSQSLLREDEHDIKLVYSCWVLNQRNPSSLFRKMASDRLGLTSGLWNKSTARC